MKNITRNSSLLLFLFFLSININHSLTIGEPEEAVSLKFLSSFSFKEPFFPDAGSSAVPGWEVKGATTVTTEYIRLTPAENGKSGYITNRRPFFLNSVNLTLAFHVHSESRFGADGMALWMIDSPLKPGICFGATETWNGLGIVFDTFSNSGKTTYSQIAIHSNDGTKNFDVNTDGENTLIGRCNSDYRNAPISFLNLIYDSGFLSGEKVKVDARGNGQWQECASVQYKLPTRYFFSLSAATGGLNDNHDVSSLSVSTMDTKSQKPRVSPAPAPSLTVEEVQSLIDKIPVENRKNTFKEQIEPIPLTKEKLNEEIFKIFPENEMEPELGDDDEDIMNKVNEIKDNFGHQLMELQSSFTDQISSMKNQIPATVKLFQSLQNEIKQIDQLLSTTLSHSAVLHKELLSAGMDANPVLKITSLANSLEAHVSKLESRTKSLNEVIEKVQADHERVRREPLMQEADPSSFFPVLLFLIVVSVVVCGGGYFCFKLVFKKKPRKVAL